MTPTWPVTIKYRRELVVAALVLCAAILLSCSHASAAASPRVAAWDARPLSFEPVDATTPSVFVARAHGTSVMVSPTDLVLRLSAPLRKDGAAWMPGRRAALQRLRLVLAGALAGRVTTVDRLRGQAHYFTGSDPARWRTNLPMWGKVRFHEVYPGIDVVYYGAHGNLEFDFVVAPGADPARIQLVLEGLDADDAVEVVPGAGVRVAFPTGEVRLRPPHAYQEIDGVTRVVDVDYVLERAVDHPPKVSLRLGSYDTARPLIIDPVLAYSSSFGITADDAGLGIAVDASGNTYVTGVADASGSDRGADAFVMKLDPSGAVAYAVHVGGTEDDGATAIAVDADGNAVVAGGTASTDFPTVNAAQETNQGGTPLATDAFVIKLSPTGTLLYSTYLGGTGDDGAYGVAVGTSGHVYVAGATKSLDFPVTGGTRPFGGAIDAFIAKIDPTVPGSGGIGYATYLGGTGDDIAHGLAVDTTGNAYVTGVTASSDFPTVLGFQASAQGGNDAFVAKLGPDGTTLPWSTYFGGSLPDAGNGIAVDATGLVYVTGSTASPNFPQKAGTLPYGGGGDAFVAKFNPVVTLGSRSLLYSSFLGGTGLDVGRAIAVDAEGSGYVAGFTESSDFPLASEAQGPQGGRDAFVTKVNMKTGGPSAVMYSTRLGGSGEDDAYGIALDAQANAYVTGMTASANFPVVGSPTSGFTGTSDGFVAKLVEPDLVISAFTVPAFGDAGAAIQVSDTTKNQGAARSGLSFTKFFLSADSGLSADDPLLGTREIPELDPGQESEATTPLTLPTPLTTGTYTIIAVADGDSTVAESREANNKFSRTVRIGPDLTVTSLTAAISGTTVTATDTTQNVGATPAPASTTYFYLALSSTRSPEDVLLGTRSVPELTGGGTSNVSTPLALPTGVTAGPYFLIAEADGDKTVTEANETNNTRTRAITLGPDLTVSVLTIAAPGGAGLPVSVTDTTINQGATAAVETVTRYFFSTDAVFDPATDTQLGERPVPALTPGQSDTATVTLTIPPGAATGTYSIIAVADATNTVTETLETNNTRTRTLAVGPDLRITFVSAPSSVSAGATISVTDITRNTGGGAATTTSTTRIYLSRDTAVSAEDIVLGSRTVPTLDPNVFDRVVTSVTIPAGTLPGAWFVIARADADGAVAETNESNQTLSQAVTVIGPDLVVSSLNAPSKAGAGAAITIDDTTLNSGGGQAGASITRFVLSTDTIVDASDPVLGSRAIGTLAGNGGLSSGSTPVTIPSETANGSYFILALADADSSLVETTRDNNVTSRVIGIGPDLTVQSLTVPPRAGAGVMISVTDSTANLGPGNALGSETRFYISASGTMADAVQIGSRPIGPLTAGTSSSLMTQVMIPSATTPGNYFILARADGGEAIFEADETNNIFVSAPLPVGGDLTIPFLGGPATAAAGATISVTDTTTNVGGGGVPASTTRFYMSRVNTLDATAIPIGSRAVPLLGGGRTSTLTTPTTLPADLTAGAWFLIALADADGVVPEISETNNTRSKPMTIGPDLTVISLTVPANAAAGATITIGDSTKNAGVGIAPTSQTRFWLSTNTILDGSDVLLGFRQVPQLNGGATSPGTTSVTLPLGIGGAYFIIAQADGPLGVGETDDTNNTRFRAIDIGPDLLVTVLTAPLEAGSGVTIAVNESTRNAGSVASLPSTTMFWLSTNSSLDSGDIFLGSRAVPGLNPGATSSAVTNLTIPEVPSGPYFILGQADGDAGIFETAELNNVRPRAINIGPDLIVSFTNPTYAAPGATISITETVTNQGGGTAVQSRSLYYLSLTPALAPDSPLIGSRDVPQLGPDGVSTGIGFATIPADTPPAVYQIIVKADGDGVVNELVEINNIVNHTIRVGPDLTVSSMTAPASARVGASITVAETVKNVSGTDAGGFVNWYYLSPDGLIGPSAVLIGERIVQPILANGLNTGSSLAVIPADTVPGSYFIVVLADGPGGIPEFNESNNTRSKAITINP
jgi:subtilase family serine protease